MIVGIQIYQINQNGQNVYWGFPKLRLYNQGQTDQMGKIKLLDDQNNQNDQRDFKKLFLGFLCVIEINVYNNKDDQSHKYDISDYYDQNYENHQFN